METLAYPRGQLRVSDADRDSAIAELSEHFQAGRLTKDEFDERTSQALQARTGKDLAALFTDLPGHQAPGSLPAAGGGRVPPVPYRAAIPLIAPVVCVIVVAVSIRGGFGGHHPVLGLAPIVAALVVARVLFLRGRTRDRRDWIWGQRDR